MWLLLALLAFVLTTFFLLLLCALLHALPKMGPSGKSLGEWLCRAPGLDLLMTIFSVGPLLVMPIFFGWAGFFGGLLGMYATLLIWTLAHETAHPEARERPRIVKVNNQMVGTFNNHAALWCMTPAVPVFWIVRMSQVVVYPLLVHFANLPRYNAGEWVNVSRHKFSGLVGHDRVWCLYCDWMTGIWSLGSEMLRNIESFWCPIRFHSHPKCENCKVDFPDVNKWVDFSVDVEAAARLLEQEYLAEPKPASNAWFGHPVRLTVKGQEPSKVAAVAEMNEVEEKPVPVEVRPAGPTPEKPFAEDPIPLEPRPEDGSDRV